MFVISDQFESQKMDEDDRIIFMGSFLCLYLLLNQKIRNNRICKTRPINRQRKQHGFFKSYFLPMKSNDREQFFKYTRMSVASFNKLLEMVTPLIRKRVVLPDAISAEERLAITLQLSTNS